MVEPFGRENQFRAFTLVEILIVIIILGILAAAVIPQFADASEDALASTLASVVSATQHQISAERVRTGSLPTTISASWYEGRRIPDHPQNTFGLPAVEVSTTSGATHPVNKVLKAGVNGAFWYNSTTGAFRVRVGDMGTAQKTLDLYNKIHHSTETTLGNYSGGGGS